MMLRSAPLKLNALKANAIKVFLASSISLLFSCGGNDGTQSSVYADSTYSAEVIGCAFAIEADMEQCDLGTLPLIGMETSSPSKNDIANRLITSQDWMGVRFMQVLDELPPDILLLFKSVTAIVIDDNINPSFYTGLTGAIYINPNGLWLTKSEQDSIKPKEDSRIGFGDNLNFISLWRYLKDGRYTSSSTEAASRPLSDIELPLAALLYHELAHANDFLPPETHSSLASSDKVYEAIEKIYENTSTSLISQDLAENLPLSSSEMIGLADVAFYGETASREQMAYTAADVGALFAEDAANDDYNFTSYDKVLFHEDVAMLFEELMMKYHYDLDRELAFTTASVDYSPFCNDYFIGWGQSGRIGDPLVKARASLVAQRLLPDDQALISFISSLNTPTQTAVGGDWCAPFRLAARRQMVGAESDTPVSASATSYDTNIDRRKRH